MAGCGGRKAARGPAPSVRAFPMPADVPTMIVSQDEKIEWMAGHYWDRLLDTTGVWVCDTTYVNGVRKDDVEEQFGIWVSMIENLLPLPKAARASSHLFESVQAFDAVRPETNVFKEICSLSRKYFYDPNSPLRDERLYLPYAQGLAGSDLIDPTLRQRYAWEASLCALNAPGTKASDFTFIDTAGRRRSLYGVKADLTLLIFGNPDCQACRELQAVMEGDEGLSAAIESGQLKVVDIYIDEDIEAWKRQKADYPASWINGYDPAQIIRTDLLYNVRALPSLYLLDADKTVLLKDCTPEQFFAALGL